MGLEIFKNDSFEVRALVDKRGEVLFCLADVCKILELTNPQNAKKSIEMEFDDDLCLTYPIVDSFR